MCCCQHNRPSFQLDNLTGTKLLTCYLAAIIHDYDHRGVNNDFLVKTSDPLALLYNDISPMESHHVAAAMTLMNEERFCFFAAPNKRVCFDAQQPFYLMCLNCFHLFCLHSVFKISS